MSVVLVCFLLVGSALSSLLELPDGRRYEIADIANCDVTRAATWDLFLHKVDRNRDLCIDTTELTAYMDATLTALNKVHIAASIAWSKLGNHTATIYEPAAFVSGCDQAGDGQVCIDDMVYPSVKCFPDCPSLAMAHERLL